MADELLTVKNLDGNDYRVSLVWWRARRKWIKVAQPHLNGGWRVETIAVAAEAIVWRGGWLALAFGQRLLINYQPDVPQRLNEATFREIVRTVVETADLSKLDSFEDDPGLEPICYARGVVPMIGYRLTLLRRRVPHLTLFEWPADRPWPFG